jgi:hypothetical protein
MTLLDSNSRPRKQYRRKTQAVPLIQKPYHFFIDPIRNRLTPSRLPKNNELVAVKPGKPTQDNVIILSDWKVDGEIHIMSTVIFSVDMVEYTFQIVPSNHSAYGMFSLVNTRTLEQYPGRMARTSSGGGTINAY